MANSVDLDDVQAFIFNLQLSLECVADVLHEIRLGSPGQSNAHRLNTSQAILAMSKDACLKLQSDIEAQFEKARSEKSK